jgi:hypothetical protein
VFKFGNYSNVKNFKTTECSDLKLFKHKKIQNFKMFRIYLREKGQKTIKIKENHRIQRTSQGKPKKNKIRPNQEKPK